MNKQDTLTLTLSGNSSILEASYFPRIELSPQRNYSLGLVSFLTFNTIPNIHSDNNKIHFTTNEYLKIPVGSYEIDSLAEFLNPHYIELKDNPNTPHSHIRSSREIDFRPTNSIAKLLGFQPQILQANIEHVSDLPVNIFKVNTIRIECSVTTGAYINGKRVHTIHEFFPAVPPGYKIIEVPTSIIYLTIFVRSIEHIEVKIVDQDGDLIEFRGETITVRLHIKSR